MKYEDTIKELNNIENASLCEKLEKLKNRENLAEEEANNLFSETVGMLFSASKEIKAPELYRVMRKDEKSLDNHEKTLFEELPLFGKDYIRFCADPIMPFVEGKIKEGEVISLMTYRKAVEENPLALMMDGFPEDSNIFEILEKDGLNKNGKESYLAVAKFIRSELTKEDKDENFIRKIKNILEGRESCMALCYSDEGADYAAVRNDVVDIFYCCTSIIVCRLDWMESKGEMVEVTPLFRSKDYILPGSEIEYEEFGDVGTFTFEMDDYR